VIVLDLESAALPADQLALVKPEFLPAANLRDPEKIKASIAEKEAAWLERAALSPLTGQILAIGTLHEGEIHIDTADEDEMLMNVWRCWNQGARFCGFNVKDFDFRFMVTRSRILNIPVPPDLFAGRYWNSLRIIDLMEVFCCFSRETSGFSLDAICRACGLGGKPEGVSGKDFARLFSENREAALEYIRNDLRLTAALAARLGVV